MRYLIEDIEENPEYNITMFNVVKNMPGEPKERLGRYSTRGLDLSEEQLVDDWAWCRAVQLLVFTNEEAT